MSTGPQPQRRQKPGSALGPVKTVNGYRPGTGAHAVSLLVAALSISGCATLLNGTYQDVHFRSDPPGATLQVDGRTTARTPVTISVERLHPMEVTFVADGYHPVTVQVDRLVSAAVLGNVFCLILPGLIVDFSTGAAYKLEREVYVRLEPLESSRNKGSRRAH